MTPPTPSRPVRITAETPPVFPCWLWDTEYIYWNRYTDMVDMLRTGRRLRNFSHYHPDQPLVPTCVPGDWPKEGDYSRHPLNDTPTAPDLPAEPWDDFPPGGVHASPEFRKAMNQPTALELLEECRQSFSDIGCEEDRPESGYTEHDALSSVHTEAERMEDKIKAFLALPAPIPVTAPLPASEGTPRTDAVETWHRNVGEGKVVPADFARTLELELTEAKNRIAVEQNCLQKELTRIASLRTLLATAENLNTELQESNKRVLSDADELATKLATAEKERDEARRLVVSSFYEDEKPFFRQGVPTHELEEVVTAKQMDGLCEKIARLTPSASQSTEMEKRVEACARAIQNNMLESLPKEHLPKNWKELNELDVVTVASIIRRHFTTPTQQ
jgi:hypothetical protein